MVKRTITITTILLILTMAVGLIVMLNKSSFAADDDIASGTSGTCSWVIDSEGVLTISPTDGISGILQTCDTTSGVNNGIWPDYRSDITKVIVKSGVSTGNGCVRIFYDLKNCTEMDLANLDTSNCTDMRGMFTNVSSLNSLDLSTWDTSNVTNMSEMFSSCSSLTSVNTSNWDTSSVTSMENMFSKNKMLNSIIGIEDWNVSNVTTMYYMFYTRRYQSGHYYSEGSLTSLDLSSWDVSKVTNMTSMFAGQYNLTNLNTNSWQLDELTSMRSMFEGCVKLERIDLSNTNVSKIENLKSAFYGCSTLEELNLSGWNTDNLKNIESAFYNCSNLIEIKGISTWNTSNVTTLKQTFTYCKKVSILNIENWNTSKVTDMSETFRGCEGLNTIDLSTWDTSNVTKMNDMFSSCKNLTSIKMDEFITNKVTSFDSMFSNCSSVVTIDISSFSSTSAASMQDMFLKMINLKEIHLGENWSFKGNNITDPSKFAYLPLPSGGTSYTHKWIIDDATYGSYLPEFLTQNYTSEMSGKWVWEEGTIDSYKVKYAVSLLGIGVNTDDHGNTMGLSFGPALGSNYVNSYKSHDANGVTSKGNLHRCIHNDDWETIINWNKEDPYVYEQCVNEGCTHSVELNLSTSFGSSNFPAYYNGDGASVLSYELYDLYNDHLFQHLTWQSFYCGGVMANGTSFGGWGASRIRAMMNGYDENTMDELGHNVDRRSNELSWKRYADPLYMNHAVVDSVTNYVGENILLNAFPDELKNAIGKTKVDYDKVVADTGGYSKTEKDTMYDKLWLLSTNEIWESPSTNYNHPNEATGVYPGLNSKTSLKGYAYTIDYGVIDGYATWLRSPYITMRTLFDSDVSYVDSISSTGETTRFGSCRGSLSSISEVGISPCFVLGNEYAPEKYQVNYSYNGTIPNGASQLPESAEYEVDSLITVAPDATAPGYTFSGWSRTGTFEMPAENVEITGSFTANTDTPYKVEHYLEDLNEGEYTLTKTDNLTGTTDTEAQATAKDYEGFTFDDSIDGTNLSGNIAGDGSLVLKVYYKRNSYNVTYAYTGDVPDDASQLPQAQTYKYGADISVPDDSTAEGYTFSGWIKDYITMPAQDIEITGYFIENPKSYKYKVDYYFDGELDDSLEEILNAEKDEEISITPQNPLKYGEKNYTLVSSNHKITISINDEENIIKVYYETDVLDYAIDNFEDTTEGDGIPDKYQIRITYKVENGSWDDGTKGTKADIITLKDKDGNLSEEGTGTTTIPEVGNKPSDEYEVGTWNEEIPKEVSNKDDGKEYIYSYKKSEKQNIEQKEETNITEASGKTYNPKTDDIVNKYLLVGIGGILVLALVSKIRRKYSRKAKKIQY